MNSKYRQHVLSVGIAAACAAWAMTASGQAHAQDAPERSEASSQAAEAQEPEAQELDRLIVTAERRSQNIQDYAGTAQIVDAETIRTLGINNDLRSVQALIPGLSIANQEGNTEIYLRGVGSANNTELGDPANAPHINGAYIPRPRGLGNMFFDIERVEVNKGPQGTLRGRNALGGTLNIITRRPALAEGESGYAQVEVGNRDYRGGEFAFNKGFGGTAGLRVSGYTIEKDSSFENAGADGSLEPAGIQDDWGVRASLMFQPNDRFSLLLMADYGKETGTGYPGANIYSATCSSSFQPCTNNGTPGPGFSPDELDLRKVIYRGEQGYLKSSNGGFLVNASYDFGPVSLAYDYSARMVDFEQRNASSEGVLWPGRNVGTTGVDYDLYSTVFWTQTSDSQVHELRLSSDDEARFRWVGGLFHFEEDQTSGFFSLADKGIFYSGTEFTMPDVRGKSSAIFFDGTFDISDSFRIKGGVRYTEEDKYRYGIGGNWTIGLGSDGFGCCFNVRLGTPGFRPALTRRPNFDVSGLTNNAEIARFLLQGILVAGGRDTLIDQLNGVIDGTRPNGTCVDRPDINGGGSQRCPADGQHSFFVLGAPAQQKGSSEFSFTDWRIGAEWDVTADNLLYATVSTGHKAGGFNDSFDPNQIPPTYSPESMVAFEIGSKNVFTLGGYNSTFNVSAFLYNIDDQVLQDLTVIGINPSDGTPSGFALANRNLGESRLWGVEAESTLQLPAGFMLNLHGLYLDTEIRKGRVADVRSQNFGAGGITSEIDLSGNELPLSSKYTFNVRLQQVFDLGEGSFDWQVLASYRSAYYLTQFNERDVVFVSDTLGTVSRVEDARTAGFPDRQRGETTLNAGLGYTTASGAWRFEAWGSNLLNNDVSQKALVGSGLNIRFLNDPRSYGLRVRYNF